MNKTIEINSMPCEAGLWAGIGGHFDSFSQIMYEMIDDSISSIKGNQIAQREVIITLHEQGEGGPVAVTVEDSGAGILNLDAAFSLGDRSGADWTLNEHGFGLKHALATVNPGNNSWSIYTRTAEDLLARQLKVICAPYKMSGLSATVRPASCWIGKMDATGTIVSFTATREMFRTLGKDILRGSDDFWELADVLCEDIGFTYSGMIQQKRVNFTLVVKSATGGPSA